MAVVGTLRVAPVKGLATVTRERIQLDEHGTAEDRRVFLLDADGAVVTLREQPALMRVVPDLDLATGRLSVQLPDGTSASSDLEDVGGEVRADLFGKARAGRVLGGEVSDALSAVAGVPLRAVLADPVGVGWDEGPVSILGRASAAELGGPEGETARYRMLVELDGTAPYEEDGWVGHEVALGEAVVRVTHPLQRCVVITMSPATGQQDWDGLHALAGARGRDNLCLGVIAAVVTPGEVRVGAEAGVARRA